MQILGHGIDIEEIALVERLLNDPHGDFLSGWFTTAEVLMGPSESGEYAAFFAGQLAAKEAVVKALGTGLVGEMAWTDIEIHRRPSGAPVVILSGEAANIADSSMITSWLLSISHTGQYAIASAIALRE